MRNEDAARPDLPAGILKAGQRLVKAGQRLVKTGQGSLNNVDKQPGPRPGMDDSRYRR
jgi:hypothetical protein